MAYPSVHVSKGKPSACLHFINVKSLNYNLKSAPRSLQPALAPVQRASHSLYPLHFSSHHLDGQIILLEALLCLIACFLSKARGRSFV